MVVNGGWSDWGPFGECDKPCGKGNKVRNRSCNNPSPEHGGKQCEGSPTNSETCKIKECSGNFMSCIRVYLMLNIRPLNTFKNKKN